MLDTGLLCRPAFADVGDQGAARLVQPQVLGDFLGHRLDADAQPTAPCAAVFAKLVDHRLGERGGNREADADAAAGGREDRGVDADHLAPEVEHRAARIAAVDRGVGLDEIVIGAGVHVARPRRDDAGGHGAAEAERVADGDDPIADPGDVGVAPFEEGKLVLAFDLQKRKVGLGVAADDLGRQMSPVLENDGDLVRPLDHVIAGHDVARGVYDEARSQRGHTPRRRLWEGAVEEVPEELFERRARRESRNLRPAVGAVPNDLGGRDIDHRWQQPLGKFGEAVRGRLGLGRTRPRQGRDDQHGGQRQRDRNQGTP